MTFTKDQIQKEMARTGVVPLFTHDNADEAKEVLRAAYDGGVRVFEFTNRKSNAFEVFAELLEQRSKYFPGLMLGIGTVMDARITERFISAGADFIISPIMKTEMASVCNHHDRLWVPGCATLTEIVTARDHGAEVIKIFPGSVLGPAFVTAIMPVVPDVKLMITGGVEPTKESLSSWFSTGAMCVGMGSQLFTKEILQQRDWEGLRKKISVLLNMVDELPERRCRLKR